MKIKLCLEDWRQIGKIESIYKTELGIKLSSGDLHSGTVFECDIEFKDKEIENEIKSYWQKHKAYPVFRLLPEKNK